MKMDMANFAVSYIRPHLMKQSVEYERSKFQEFLDRHPSEGLLSLLLRCSNNPPPPTEGRTCNLYRERPRIQTNIHILFHIQFFVGCFFVVRHFWLLFPLLSLTTVTCCTSSSSSLHPYHPTSCTSLPSPYLVSPSAPFCPPGGHLLLGQPVFTSGRKVPPFLQLYGPVLGNQAVHHVLHCGFLD